MKIESAKTSEIASIQNVARRVILHNYAPFLGQQAATHFVESGQSDQEIVEGADRCCVMKEGDLLVGFAMAKDDLLHLLMIDTPYQNKGYGTVLLRHVEEAMFQEYSVIHLQSFEENIAAHRFYEKNGWQVTGIKSENGITLLLFEKARK